jgi:serine/threonine protein kinase
MDSGSMSSADRTNEGQVLGTPLYMAPEQAAGRLDELDFRTDIYGLGAILFAIVTGNAPHEKTQKESVHSGLGARGMISVIASGVAPSARDVNPAVDPALDAICSKAMARRRYARYQEAIDLAEDVQRWMAGEKVTAYRETFWQRTSRWIAQHRRLSQSLVAAAMVVLVALTTLAMAARQNRLTARHARFAQMESDVREVELQMRGMWTELAKDARLLASLPPIQGIVNASSGNAGESEETWRAQLQSVFSGMLRSSPYYLSLSFEAKEGDSAKEIVRAERNPAEPTLVRVLPTSSLQTVKADELMAAVATLQPGDVKFSLEPRTRHGNNPSRLERLSVATPVHSDVSGAYFGMTVIEADVLTRVMEVLTDLGAVDCEIYVGDGLGQMWGWVNPQTGVQISDPEQAIPGLPKEVAEQLSKKGAPFLLRGQDSYVAQRFYVDPTGRGVLIFARLTDDK